MEQKNNVQQLPNQHLKYRQQAPVPLAKDIPGLPDFFTVVMELRSGEKRTYEAIDFTFLNDSRCFQIQLANEEFRVIPQDVITEFVFDKNFTAILEAKRKLVNDFRAQQAAAATAKGGSANAENSNPH